MYVETSYIPRIDDYGTEVTFTAESFFPTPYVSVAQQANVLYPSFEITYFGPQVSDPQTATMYWQYDDETPPNKIGISMLAQDDLPFWSLVATIKIKVKPETANAAKRDAAANGWKIRIIQNIIAQEEWEERRLDWDETLLTRLPATDGGATSDAQTFTTDGQSHTLGVEDSPVFYYIPLNRRFGGEPENELMNLSRRITFAVALFAEGPNKEYVWLKWVKWRMTYGISFTSTPTPAGKEWSLTLDYGETIILGQGDGLGYPVVLEQLIIPEDVIIPKP